MKVIYRKWRAIGEGKKKENSAYLQKSLTSFVLTFQRHKKGIKTDSSDYKKENIAEKYFYSGSTSMLNYAERAIVQNIILWISGLSMPQEKLQRVCVLK